MWGPQRLPQRRDRTCRGKLRKDVQSRRALPAGSTELMFLDPRARRWRNIPSFWSPRCANRGPGPTLGGLKSQSAPSEHSGIRADVSHRKPEEKSLTRESQTTPLQTSHEPKRQVQEKYRNFRKLDENPQAAARGGPPGVRQGPPQNRSKVPNQPRERQSKT